MLAGQRRDYISRREENMNEMKSSYINNEINNSLTQIENNKTLALGAIKIYLLIFFSLFTYAAFLQTKIITDVNIVLPSTKYFMFSVFGAILTIITTSLGWILIDYITGLIYKAIINYKHMSYMRNLSSELFFNKELINHCVLPIGSSIVHLERSRHLPIVFSVINMLILSMNYYFLQISFHPKLALTVTFSIFFVFALLFPNACKKLEEEKRIAQKLSPSNIDEKKIRDNLVEIKKEKRGSKEFKCFFRITIILSCIFLLMIVYNIYHCVDNNLISLSNWLFAIEGILVLIIAAIIYYMSIVETK